MKLPGTYAMYALFLRLFGDDARAIRIGLLLANAASIVLLFLLARTIARPTAAGARAPPPPPPPPAPPPPPPPPLPPRPSRPRPPRPPPPPPPFFSFCPRWRGSSA